MKTIPLTADLCRVLEVAADVTDLGPGVVMVDDSNFPIAAFGVAMLWPGVGEGWAAVSPGISLTSLMYIRRTLPEEINRVAERLQLHRLHVHADVTNMRALRFASAFGFTPESTLRKFGPDQHDYVCLVRFFQ